VRSVCAILFGLVLALLVPSFWHVSGAQAASRVSITNSQRLHRSLDTVPAAVPYPWVVGRDWPRSTLVALTVRYGTGVSRASIRARPDGSFGVGIKGVRWCAGLVVEAVDATGYRVVLHGVSVFRGCPPVTEAGGIDIDGLSGRDLQVRQYFVDGDHPARSYTVHIGDMLYVYVPDSHPILPAVDRQHFRMFEHGTIPACPGNADCIPRPGVYYKVVAVHPGQARLPIGRQRHTTIRVIA
jgi:hypothetical protein